MDISLSKFLEASNVKDLRDTYYMKRFDTTFTVSAMTDQQLSDYQQSCFKKDDGKGNKKTSASQRKLDFGKFKKMVIERHVIEPNISDPEFLKQGGWALASEFIDDKLTPGEVMDMYQVINKLSGFEDTLEDDIEDAKN